MGSPPPLFRLSESVLRVAGRFSIGAAQMVLPRAARAIPLEDLRRDVPEGTEFLTARTEDGVTLTIERVRPVGVTRGAVLLVHGLSGNGAVFNVQGRSLARYLADLGYDCFVPDLRGARYSERPRHAWGLDEYVEYDIPAVIAAVRESSGSSDLTWVGHSLGGLLFLFYAIERSVVPVQRAVTIGSAIDYRPGKSIYRDLRRLLPITEGLKYVPFGHLARATASFAGRGPILLPERMNFHRSNIEPEIAAALLREFHHVPVGLFRALDTAFAEEGFSRDGGRIRYLEQAARYAVPTLFIGGSRDPHCSPEAIHATAELLKSHSKNRVVVFGRAYGHSTDYSHFDLLVGRAAPTEVWPEIARFLAVESM